MPCTRPVPTRSLLPSSAAAVGSATGLRLILANGSSMLGVCVYAGCNSQHEVGSAAVIGSLEVSTRAAQGLWAEDSPLLSVGWWPPAVPSIHVQGHWVMGGTPPHQTSKMKMSSHGSWAFQSLAASTHMERQMWVNVPSQSQGGRDRQMPGTLWPA